MWLHPRDRIVKRRVIPTRIEMLAELRVWGRAEDIAEHIAVADVNVQQGAVWGYNDGGPELEDWGGFHTLYHQVRSLSGHRAVGRGITQPSLLRIGGERIAAAAGGKQRQKPRQRVAMSDRAGTAKRRGGSGGGGDIGVSESAEYDALLNRPSVETVRGWMRELKSGELPTWNRGVEGVWLAYLTGFGTKHYKNRCAELYTCCIYSYCSSVVDVCESCDGLTCSQRGVPVPVTALMCGAAASQPSAHRCDLRGALGGTRRAEAQPPAPWHGRALCMTRAMNT